MSAFWMTILRLALSVVITAVAKIPPDRWAQLGTVAVAWLQKLEDALPAGNPLVAAINAYRAPRSKLARFRPESDDE